jgi:nitrate/nitrite transporter NarK
VLALAYALSFGVELTTHNVVALYLYGYFGLSLTTSGLLGASYRALVVVVSSMSKHLLDSVMYHVVPSPPSPPPYTRTHT